MKNIALYLTYNKCQLPKVMPPIFKQHSFHFPVQLRKPIDAQVIPCLMLRKHSCLMSDCLINDVMSNRDLCCIILGLCLFQFHHVGSQAAFTKVKLWMKRTGKVQK